MKGSAGTATCAVKDTTGSFDLPRAVVEAAQGDAGRSSPVSLSISRQRKEVRRGKTVKGSLAVATVQPTGWLELSTVSTETASFQGCTTSQELCDDVCTNVTTDRQNCGACGEACSSSETCSGGTCVPATSGTTCKSCRTTALGGTCYNASYACQGDYECSVYSACFLACSTTSCQYTCQSTYPAGYGKISSVRSCLSSSCQSACSGLN